MDRGIICSLGSGHLCLSMQNSTERIRGHGGAELLGKLSVCLDLNYSRVK